jgi:anti-anti-sigma factor
MLPLLEVRSLGDRVSLHGELDLATVPLLQVALDRRPAGSVAIVDLAAMTFVDSAGLAGLLTIVRSGTRVRLVNPSRAALRTMVMAGVERELMDA